MISEGDVIFFITLLHLYKKLEDPDLLYNVDIIGEA